jgi:Mg2+/Co2+ transporter CorB
MVLNLLCPYDVTLTENEDSQTYSFSTAAESVYSLAFQKANEILTGSGLESVDCFNIIISRNNRFKLKSDPAIRATVEQILIHFFEDKQRLLIYQYDNDDGKGVTRSRLFSFWYNSSETKSIIRKLESTIAESETTTYTVGLLHHVSNRISDSTIREEFNSIVYILNSHKGA